VTENTALLCDANNDDLPDDIPLGNHSPLLVPPPLGQSFLQPKFIYPLGAVSLVNPDNLAAENDFEPINSFDGSPFFDQPLQSNFSTAVETQATNQPNIQTKALAAGNRLQQSVQAKRSPINSPQSNSIQRKTVGSSQAQPPNSPLNLPSQELSANPSLNHDFHPSLDADTSENIAVQRSDDLTIIDRTNSNSDRPIQTESSLFTVENNQTNTLQRQADGSNVDNITQSEYLQQNYSEINLPNPAANLTSSNLQQIQRSPIADNISESDRLEKYQITSDSSTADIQNAQIHQLNSELPLTDSDTVSDSLAGDRTIQRASNLVDTANIPQVSQVPQADAIQRKANTAPVSNPVSSNPVNSPVDNPINNIPQVDLTQQIQGQTDLSNSENTAVSNNTQQIQRFAESPVLDRVAESDRTIQREPSLSSVDNTQPFQSAPLQQSGIYSGISNENTIPEVNPTIQRESLGSVADITQSNEVQRQTDVNRISQADYTQLAQTDEIQRQPDLSTRDSTPAINSNPSSQMSSEAPIASESDRPIQQSSTLPNIDIRQSPQTTSIQRQADQPNIADLAESSSSPANNNSQQIQSPIEPAVLKDVPESDQTIQRQSDSELTDRAIFSTDEIQRQPDASVANNISESEYIQPIQRQLDKSIPNDNPLHKNIQPIPETSEAPVLDNLIQDNRRTIQREVDLPSPVDISQDLQTNEIQRQADSSNGNSVPEKDIHLSSDDITQNSLTDNVQRQPDLFAVDNNIVGDSRTQPIQSEPDLSTFGISTNKDPQQIQRFSDSDISRVDHISEGIQRESSLSPELSQSRQTDAIQKETNVSVVGSVDQSDRTIQRETDLSPTDSTPTPQSNVIQRQPDISTVDNNISEDSLTQQIQKTSDFPNSDIANSNIPQTTRASEFPIFDSITESDRPQQVQTNPDVQTSDISANRDSQQIQRLVDTNVSDVDINSENIQRRTDLSADVPTRFQADTAQRQSDILLANNAFQSDRSVQREQDLSPIDSTQIPHINEIQRQTDISEVASISQSDRTETIQRNYDLSSTDSKQTYQADIIQKQPDISTLSSSISEDSLTQEIQRTSDLPDSDITPNNIQQIAEVSESPVLGSITESDRTQKIQTKTDVSTSDISTNRDPQQIQRLVDTDISDVDINSENAQRITDLSAVEPTEFQANTTQRQSDVSLVDNAFQSDRTIQRESDLSAVDNKQYSQINEAQKQSDGFMGKDIQPLQRFSEPPILDSFPEGDRPIQKASESSPVERMQILHTNEIQKQPDTLEVNSIAESDHPIQRDSDLSSADSTQLPQVEGSQRELDISTVDNSIFGGDRPQPIQTKPDVQTSDISANRDSQQIQRIDNTDISAVGSISESIQQKSDDSAIDDISQGDRTVQRKSDLFNNIDITQSPYSNDTQRQSDVSLNSLTEGDVSQQIKQTDPSISDSNNLTNIVQPLQRETDISTVDIQQNDLSDELQRQSDLSLVDNSISGDNHTQQIQRTSDLPNSDSDAPSNTQQVAIAEDNTSSTEQNIQRDTELFNSIVSPQSFQTTDNQETSSLPVDAAEIMSQGNLAPQTQPTNLSIADGFITSNSDQSIQRESLVDNSSQNDRNISSSRDISALDSKQDSQANEIQRQPNISDVDRIAQSDRSTIQSNSDLTPVSSTQTPQVDGIQRQIASELSPVDITQSSPTSEIQRLSNISVDDITQGDLTQATQRTDSTTDSNTDSSVNTIQRQSDVTVTDLSQSNYTPQRGSNEADVNIKNDITSSLQNETIQRQFDHDISTVDNVYQNNSVIQRESDLSVVDTTQSSVTNDAQSKLQREIVDSTVDNISQVDRIQPVQGNLNNSEANNVDSTLAIDRPNVIQREIDLVALEPEVSSQISENLDHENRQQIQKKPDQEKEDTTNNQTSVEQNTNQTILQMLADPSNTEDLQLPKAIENLAHTDYLGNFSLLPSLQTSSPITSQAIQRSPTKRPGQPTQSSLPNSLNNFAKTIQPMQDKNSDSSNSQTNSTGWANISELLANLPPSPKASSSTSSLNKQTNTGDRSPLATSPSSSSTSSNGNQTTIQRSLDKTTYKDNDIEQDLYLTPSGLQKGNPHKIANTRPNAIQRELTSDTLPEVKVSVNSRQDPNNDSYDKENFEKNLETLAQEIYILLRHRLEIEKERQGGKYQGRLPW